MISEGRLEANMDSRISDGPMIRSSSVHIPGNGSKSERGNHEDLEMEQDHLSNGMSYLSQSHAQDKDFEVLSQHGIDYDTFDRIQKKH